MKKILRVEGDIEHTVTSVIVSHHTLIQALCDYTIFDADFDVVDISMGEVKRLNHIAQMVTREYLLKHPSTDQSLLGLPSEEKSRS